MEAVQASAYGESEMIRLNQELTEAIVLSLPKDLQRLLIKYASNLCIAGGYIRDFMLSEDAKDIDVFATTEKDLLAAVEEFDWTRGYVKSPTANAFTFRAPYGDVPIIQFVKRCYYPTHRKLLESFDFTVCQVCIFYSPSEGWVGYCTEEFLRDFEEKVLVYTSPQRDEDPAGSFLRVVRFLKRGFTISEEELSKVLARLVASISTVQEPVIQQQIQARFRQVGYGGHRRDEAA